MRYAFFIVISLLTLLSAFLFYQDFRSLDVPLSPPQDLQCGELISESRTISQGTSFRVSKRYSKVLDYSGYHAPLYASIYDGFPLDQDSAIRDAQNEAKQKCKQGLISGQVFGLAIPQGGAIEFSCEKAREICTSSGRVGCEVIPPYVNPVGEDGPQPDISVSYDCRDNFVDVVKKTFWYRERAGDLIPIAVDFATYEFSCTCTVEETFKGSVSYGCSGCTELP